MPENTKYKNNLQKLTEATVRYILPFLIVLNGLGSSNIIKTSFLKTFVIDFGWGLKVLFLMGLIILVIDTILFGEKVNSIINRLVSNLGKLIVNAFIAIVILISIDLTLSQIFNLQSFLFTIDSKLLKPKQNVFWFFADSYQSVFAPVLIIISVFMGFWLVSFLLRYFRVFNNHGLQNVLIKSFIDKRGYKPKLKTVRQKIEEVKKIQAYNKEYNSNYNNFTKYDTNLPTNRDFTFDYLEIQGYNSKTGLAALNTKAE